jgi:hypothetical protein
VTSTLIVEILVALDFSLSLETQSCCISSKALNRVWLALHVSKLQLQPPSRGWSRAVESFRLLRRQSHPYKVIEFFSGELMGFTGKIGLISSFQG